MDSLARSKGFQAAAFTAAVLLLLFFWAQNYNKLANFYDYSIMTAAAGNLAAGLRPHRDFASTAQPLSLWVARACEMLFGQRYLALAYGNLILSGALFLTVFWYSRKAFSFYLALLLALGITAGSTLQHGIVWYNSIGIVILTAITLQGAAMVRAKFVSVPGALAIFTLIILGGLNKVNFHIVDLGIVFLFWLVLWNSGSIGWRKSAMFLAGMAVCAVAPIIIETLWTHITWSSWLQTIVLGPSGRTQRLRFILHKSFYLKPPQLYYDGALHPALVGFCTVMYLFIASAAGFTAPAARRSAGLKMDNSLSHNPAVLVIVLVGAFLALTFIVITTNTDMQTLTGSYFVVGAIAIAMISGSALGPGFERSLNVCCATMAAYFLIFGGISCWRHARISYTEPAQFSDASGIADRLPSYLRGVHLSQVSAERIAAVDSAIRKESPAGPPCWGPGLGLMTRIYGGVSDPGIPLWYHYGVTVYPSSSPALISAIEHSGCSVVICDPVWITQFPQPVVQHLDAVWIKEENPLLIVYHRPRVTALN